ncbi:MAG: acylphosphatase, partial [Methanocellales archaeon]|nr:acylphosphatase [Methanocellales archaeon]
MVKARILVEGFVQGVGYRALVKNIDRKMKIKGYVKNLDDGTVEIYCESTKSVIEDFIKRMERKTEYPDEFSLSVERIFVRYEGEQGYIQPSRELGIFETDYGEEAKSAFEKANLEKLEIGTLVMSKLRDETNYNFRTMDERYTISTNVEALTKEIRDTNQNVETLAKTFVRLVDTLER